MVSSKALNLLPLSVHSGHDRTCRWHDPVANDTLQTLVDPSSIRTKLKTTHSLFAPQLHFWHGHSWLPGEARFGG
jgi:hypothetical protein